MNQSPESLINWKPGRRLGVRISRNDKNSEVADLRDLTKVTRCPAFLFLLFPMGSSEEVSFSCPCRFYFKLPGLRIDPSVCLERNRNRHY